MCVVRGTGGEEAQPARRRHRHGELRDREGARRGDRGGVRPTTSSSVVGETGYTAGVATPGRSSGRGRDRLAAPPPAGLAGPHGPGGRHGDGAGAPVRLLAVGLAGPGHARRALGRLAVPPRRVDQPAAPGDDDGHAHLRRDTGRIRLVALCAALRYRRRDRHAARVRADRPARRGIVVRLLRGRSGRDDVHPRRSLPRVPLEAAGRERRSALCSSWARSRSRCCEPGPTATSSRGCRRRPSRSGCGSWSVRARRSPPTGSIESRALSGRRVTGDRRVGARGGRSGRPRRRLDGQHQRTAGRAGDPGRRRHPAGSDGPSRRGRPERQGRRPAPGRPGVRGVRARRHRPGAGRARGVGAAGLRPGRRAHRRGRRPHHRLPLRARPGHAHGADGRHRSGRPARHPHPRPGGARDRRAPSTRSCSTRPARSRPG